MKKVFFSLIAVCFLFTAKAQLTKSNWLVGGTGSFSFMSPNTVNGNTKTTIVNLAPNIGYFFIDKFASGIRLTFYDDHINYGQPNNNSITFSNYSIGPFIRYYFLPVDKQYNIITEGNYQFGNEKVQTSNSLTTSNSNSFSFAAGPVIYFNSSVGIEFLLNYTSSGNNINSKRGNSFKIGIGLQVHLEKDK